MDELPIVVIGVRGGVVADLIVKGPTRVVHLNWDELTTASLGRLREAYGRVWDIPEDVREGPLCALIREVRRRFPFTAQFIPQQYVDGFLKPDGPPFTFDITEPVLRLGPDGMENLVDRCYPTWELARGLPEREAHTGPFDVEIDRMSLDFLYAEENEEQAHAQERAT
jgi:hypothetical protein